MSKITTWYIWMVTYLCSNVITVCGTSYHLLGSWISWDSKIRFWLQVESYISDWQFSKSWHLASYVSRHNAMAYDKVYWYLGCLLLQDEDDIQAVQSQLCKARRMWARVGQVLCKENTPPQVAPSFTRGSSNPSSCTDARRGFWAKLSWPGSRDSSSARGIVWQGSTPCWGLHCQ